MFSALHPVAALPAHVKTVNHSVLLIKLFFSLLSHLRLITCDCSKSNKKKETWASTSNKHEMPRHDQPRRVTIGPEREPINTCSVSGV